MIKLYFNPKWIDFLIIRMLFLCVIFILIPTIIIACHATNEKQSVQTQGSNATLDNKYPLLDETIPTYKDRDTFITLSSTIAAVKFTSSTLQNKTTPSKPLNPLKSHLQPETTLENSSPNSLLSSIADLPDEKKFIDLGDFTQQSLATLIQQTLSIHPPNERMIAISNAFLGIPYARTNIGSPAEYNDNQELITPAIPEKFTVDLRGMDCVTFIEYTLALAHAQSYHNFLEHLLAIKYKDSQVLYSNRNHYMMHWTINNEAQGYVSNITQTFRPHTETIQKNLSILESLGVFPLTLEYIPQSAIPAIQSQLQNGDLVYLVSEREDLDVSHVTMIHVRNSIPHIRHAKYKQTVQDDTSLIQYLQGRSSLGIVVVRPTLQ